MNTENTDNLQNIYNSLKEDPTLCSKIDINEILQLANKETYENISNTTLETISMDIFKAISKLNISMDAIKNMCLKLTEYRFVDELHELRRGKYVRWIRKNAPEIITNGGIIVDIRFLDTGTYIIIKYGKSRVLQYKFDDCITFQKMTYDEHLILTIIDIINKRDNAEYVNNNTNDDDDDDDDDDNDDEDTNYGAEH
jgi:hypothetical protein